MSVQVNSLLGQTEGERNDFFAGFTAQKMKFSIKDFFVKCDQIRSFMRIFFTFTKENLNGKLYFLCSGSRKGATLWDYLQEYLVVMRDNKVSPFVKFELILHLLCLLLATLKNKHCRTWSSRINLWILQDPSKVKNLVVNKAKV